MSDAETEGTNTDPPIFNIVAGILLATLSLWLLIVTIPNNISQTAGKNDISPSLFPTLTAWGLLGLSLLLISINALKLHLQGSNRQSQNGFWILTQFVVWMITATLVYFGLLAVGFVTVACMLIGLVALASGYRNFWMTCILAVAMPLITSQLAWSIFQVQLP